MREKILSQLAAEDFVGRAGEMDELLRHARSDTGANGMLLLSAPAIGSSELLRQVYDQLFYEQGEVIPVYFSFSKNDQTPEQVAKRFLQTCLLNVVAFRRNDRSLIGSSPDICELSELSVPADGHWIDRLVAACESKSPLQDERSFVRQALSAPLRAKAHSAVLFVIFDNFHFLEGIRGEVNFLDELKEIYRRSTVRFVFSGRRRYTLRAIQSGHIKLQSVETLRLDVLPDADARLWIESLSETMGVKTNPQTVDLLVQQFRGNPPFITSMFLTAQEKRANFKSFHELQKVYIQALLGGRIGKYYETILDDVTTNLQLQNRIVDLLAQGDRQTQLDSWRTRLNIDEAAFRRVLNLLHVHEVIRLNSGMIEVTTDNEILSDYLQSRYRMEIVGESRALVVGNMLSEALKRAPNTMMRHYRRNTSIGLRELLAVFNCQSVPHCLLNYALYKEDFKGLEDEEVIVGLDSQTDKVELPLIVYTANCAAFYPPINQVADDERSAVALGFERGSYSDENEIVWITAEIDSKLEASAELAEFWCDRLEMVALMCNFRKYQLWLITPEGFSAEASALLAQRGAFGSSRRQVNLLIKHLKAEELIKETLKPNEYEIVVPMGEDTEMIAAHTVEEIARRHHFQPKAINQIKTALVEACINAAEHSMSPDRKIHQKFTVEDGRILITVSNRGVKIPGRKINESAMPIEPSEGRRGWGLKLMRNLMDEVKFEQIDDGTRISMVKYLK